MKSKLYKIIFLPLLLICLACKDKKEYKRENYSNELRLEEKKIMSILNVLRSDSSEVKISKIKADFQISLEEKKVQLTQSLNDIENSCQLRIEVFLDNKNLKLIAEALKSEIEMASSMQKLDFIKNIIQSFGGWFKIACQNAKYDKLLSNKKQILLSNLEILLNKCTEVENAKKRELHLFINQIVLAASIGELGKLGSKFINRFNQFCER